MAVLKSISPPHKWGARRESPVRVQRRLEYKTSAPLHCKIVNVSAPRVHFSASASPLLCGKFPVWLRLRRAISLREKDPLKTAKSHFLLSKSMIFAVLPPFPL
jgi:hypothetical protein